MRRPLGVLLCLVAAFMALGFFTVGQLSLAAVVAALIGVGIPGTAGVMLLRGEGPANDQRRAQLRRQTIESEVLRLAARSGGKLTNVEVVAELAIDAEEGQQILDSMARRELAEIQVSDSGVLVYDFRDLRHLHEKGDARGVLDG